MGDRYEAYSAGIDISGQTSKGMGKYQGVLFDLTVAVCDKAREACPICGVSLQVPDKTPAAKKIIHRTFKDPALAECSYEEQLDAFWQVRDEIRDWIAQTFKDQAV
jgi:arsenate reductase